MRNRALGGLVLLVMVGTMLIGCGGGARPAAMVKFQEGLTEGQSLSEVQTSMPDELKARATVYPAKKMVQMTDGWGFSGKEDGAAGDTDAPFQVLLVAPELDSADTLAILFDDKTFVDSVWYPPTSVSLLKTELLGTILKNATEAE